jgi:hypothetical protein
VEATVTDKERPEQPEHFYDYTGDPDDPEAPYFIGVPRRDLTKEEWEALDPARQKDITSGDNPLYVKHGAAKRGARAEGAKAEGANSVEAEAEAP